ncbi:hypothetical protein ACKWTF_008200 [Chironomus riparius]
MQWYSLNTIWMIAITIELTSQSEILIIRHGRSRSRHSSEKEHIRWGLKALDNQTIIENRDTLVESKEQNEANADVNVVSFYEHNGTLSPTNEFNGSIGSYEINYTFGPSSRVGNYNSGSDEQRNKKRHFDWQYHSQVLHEQMQTTTEMSPKRYPSKKVPSTAATSPLYNVSQGKRRNGKRKEFMTNIKSTVNKGIQYLKAHENLDEIEIEINDYNTRRNRDEMKRTETAKADMVAVKSNKMRSQSIDKAKANKIESMHYKQQEKEQQQQHKYHSPKQIKINGNGNKDFSIVKITSSESNGKGGGVNNKNNINPTITTQQKFKKSSINEKQITQRHAASKHIKIHQAHNEIDMNIKSNLADIFYVPTSPKENPAYYNDEQMLSDEPAGNVGNKMDIKESLMEKSNQHNQTKNDANQKHDIKNSTVASYSSHSAVGGKTKQNATHANGFNNKNTTMHTDKANKSSIKDFNSSPHELPTNERHEANVQHLVNDEISNDEQQNEEFINSIDIQNDDTSNENTIDFDSEFEDSTNLNNVFHEEDLDLSDLDETSRNNRKNLMRGRDVVTRFLQIVESQHMLGNNCTAGTALNLGEGVVDRYAQDRFRVEAEVAVNRANMLTRIFKMSPAVQKDINLLHASVLSMVEFDEDIFAAGHCFDENQNPLKKGLFCPFAHRLPPPEIASLAKDLANEYHYLGNTSEWFFLARKNAEKVIAKNEQYIKAYHSYTNDSERHATEILSVKYEDGRWSKPYFDCGGGNIWMLTYTVPFFGYENGTYFFKGTSGIDIDLRRVDIDQCPQKNSGALEKQPLNIFAGTDKCKQRTTECSPISGLGFRRGSYKCICRRGYYFPDVKSELKYFNGTNLEEEYAKWMQNEPSSYIEPMSFECLPCAEGCDICEDSSPCVAELNWPMRMSILILACAVIGFLPPAAYFTFRYQQVKIVKAASPALLRVIAMGAFLIYCTTIVMYPNPSLYSCVAKIWLREIGFSLTYGALMLKTWRISVIFRVRSAKAIKITDASLIKKLSLLCGFVSVALLIRTLVSPPDVIVGRTADNLKAFLCKTDWWDHTFTSMEVLFLAWGVRLCIVVRKAPSEFNESRFISMAIYNEFLLTCFLNVSMLFLQSPANPDLLYIIFFCHTQLTVTLLLALIFGSKVYLVFRNGGKCLEETIHSKSNAAKFISRPQPRTYASASSVNASSGQLQHPNGADNNRLSENEAVEEIKQLAKQLQNLYERIPQRGTATNVILTLLDICRSAQNGGTPNQLMLKPPQQVNEQAKALSGDKNSTYVDKETNTCHDDYLYQSSDVDSRFKISDKCDKDNHLNCDKCKDIKHKKTKSKCCEANNIISCSTNSINFENLQLQCMCSSDNNSIEEYQIDDDNCDGCKHIDHKSPNRVQKILRDETHSHPSSFRERLLNFTSANVGVTKYGEATNSNNLRKRNSELVLGTNFESGTTATSVYKNCQSYRISKTFDSCDNIFSQKQPSDHNRTHVTNKSNHSLSTESDQKSIPYSFLERPSMKLSHSEDQNIKDLKIALSSTLPMANNATYNPLVSNPTNNKAQTIGNLKSSNLITHSQSCTSTSSTSSKNDKISYSLSTSSTSESIVRRQKQQQQQHQQHLLNNQKDSSKMALDEQPQQQVTTQSQSIDNQNDNKNEDNKMIIGTSCDNKVASSNVNNNNINNNGNNGSSRRKGKGSESKLAIDLNDRSKYTEEVSV